MIGSLYSITRIKDDLYVPTSSEGKFPQHVKRHQSVLSTFMFCFVAVVVFFLKQQPPGIVARLRGSHFLAGPGGWENVGELTGSKTAPVRSGSFLKWLHKKRTSLKMTPISSESA